MLYLNVVATPLPKKKHFNAEIHLPNSNWFDHLSFFAVWTVYFKLKQFNTFWRVAPGGISKACRCPKYRNWIQSQAGINANVESQKPAIFVKAWDALHDWKENLHEMIKILTAFREKLKNSLTGMWKFLRFSETRRNPISTKNKQNAYAPVWGLRFGRLQSTINVFYFFRMICGNYKILPVRKKTIILFMRKLRQIYSR